MTDARGLSHLEDLLEATKPAEQFDSVEVLVPSEHVQEEWPEPTCLVLLYNAERQMWLLFEGKVKQAERRFQVGRHVQAFAPNLKNPARPPTQSVDIAIACAQAAGLSLWLP